MTATFVWIPLISGLASDCEFEMPADEASLNEAESKLDVRLPESLRSVLLESNGTTVEHGLGLIWSTDRIVETNLQFRQDPSLRELYMPFDSLLFFGDAGTGDQFGFPIHAGQISRPHVFVWDHEDDSRMWAAPSLKTYIEWCLTGKLKV